MLTEVTSVLKKIDNLMDEIKQANDLLINNVNSKLNSFLNLEKIIPKEKKKLINFYHTQRQSINMMVQDTYKIANDNHQKLYDLKEKINKNSKTLELLETEFHEKKSKYQKDFDEYQKISTEFSNEAENLNKKYLSALKLKALQNLSQNIQYMKDAYELMNQQLRTLEKNNS